MGEQTTVVSKVDFGITNKLIDDLSIQLKDKQKSGLKFPPNYSVENALNGAYLMLKEATDKSGRPLLEVCTNVSIANALMSMATQGLNPIKKQCYFIAMGSKCTMMPSYFGTLAVAKRVGTLLNEPVANVIYEGDDFEYEINAESGEIRILKHKQSLFNIDSSKIVGAYAIIKTEKSNIIEIMNINQIKSSWGMGAAKGNSKAHNNFSEEMAKKTVLNRACKRLINSSDDSSIIGDEVIQAYNETADNDYIDAVAVEVKEEITQNANQSEFLPEPQELGETNESSSHSQKIEPDPASSQDVQVKMDF